MTAHNRVGEGPVSVEIEARAQSLPGKLARPERVSSVVVAGVTSTTSITVKWYSVDLLDTGGVPLTGFKLYSFV